MAAALNCMVGHVVTTRVRLLKRLQPIEGSRTLKGGRMKAFQFGGGLAGELPATEFRQGPAHEPGHETKS
jgi:hypothetical protein